MPNAERRTSLYEICVQSVSHLVPLLRAIHGGDPKTLGEDFAGSAALSRHWCQTIEGARAIAVDRDPEALARAAGTPGITTIVGDVLADTDPSAHACDILFVGNFSIGYLHTRAELVAYLKHAHARLSSPVPDGGGVTRVRERDGGGLPPSTSPERKRGDPPSEPLAQARETPARAEGSEGVFICDTYAGESAFLTGEVHRYHPIPDDRLAELGAEPGDRIRYTWEQRAADPLTGMVTNALHFRLERAGTILAELDDAFVYHWRLWSVPELRDAMLEAGFARTAVYNQEPDAIDSDGNAHVEPTTPDDLDDSFIVYMAGWT